MASVYGQFCPLSLATELLCQRWTLLVVSRIIGGCTRFSEIQRGLPRMSPTLLSERLAELERAGVIHGVGKPGVRGREYRLTPAGEELAPLIQSMAVWGRRWSRDMDLEDLDPAFLLWSMHARIDGDAMPSGRTVIEFAFTEAPPDCRMFWLVHEDGKTEMCLKHPGHEVDVKVRSNLRVFIEAWRGFRDLESEIRARRIRVIGPAGLRKQFPTWLLLNSLGHVLRMRPGRERRLSRVTGPRRRAASPT